MWFYIKIYPMILHKIDFLIDMCKYNYCCIQTINITSKEKWIKLSKKE